MKKSIFFIKEGPKEVDFDMEKVFLRNESVDVVSTASDNLKFFLDEKLLKLDNILKKRHGELINCLKDVELRVERVEKEMIDNGFKLVQRDFITSDSKDFEKKSPEIDDSFSKKEDNLPNISIGQEELDALLEGINYTPKESELVQHDVKFNKNKDFDLTSNLHTADNFSNNLIKKEGIDVGSDNVSLENMELNNNKDHNEKLESFIDNKQHLDLIDENGNIEYENSVNCTVLKSSGDEPIELKEFDDFESILKKDLDSQTIEGSFSNDGEKNLRDSLRDVADQDQDNNIANCEKLSSQSIIEDHSSSHFNFNDVEKVVSKFNAEESLSNVVLNSDEKTVLINFIDRVESELELNPNRNIFKAKQEYEVLKKVKFLLTKG
ncbi:hypothetical protein BgCN_0778 [Borreliella garinii NMJW1]|uniref:hypothetical protein n=1 Tax=Borreliella TaxID=64895 RepID=UPI000286DB9D|nr:MULTISPECIES: hypothetical protein [Borreliella]AFT84058.1 hypothetical protein BgCN_0778 [Borreliella garinii NMJW1]AHZ73815.1 hypothetical protein X921_00485 [Borreliella garinii SZ]